MKYYFIPLVFGIIFNACSQNVPLTNTKWECKIADDCINTYTFKTDSTFIFYNCEMDDILYGNYLLKRDTLVLDTKSSVYDNVYDEDSPHRYERKKYIAIIQDNTIKYLWLEELTNGKWSKSDFKFTNDYLYIKSE